MTNNHIRAICLFDLVKLRRVSRTTCRVLLPYPLIILEISRPFNRNCSRHASRRASLELHYTILSMSFKTTESPPSTTAYEHSLCQIHSVRTFLYKVLYNQTSSTNHERTNKIKYTSVPRVIYQTYMY